jgi:hypothetical protein
VAEGPFPYVRLRGPVAIVGLSSAVARLPLVASGTLGGAQIAALERLLGHPEVRKRTPVILTHHPAHNPASRAKTLLEGLLDAEALHAAVGHLERGLFLHGHLHRRVHRTIPTRSGRIDAVGATSASLLDERHERMAGFNLYEVDDHGHVASIRSLRWSGDGFLETEVPRA